MSLLQLSTSEAISQEEIILVLRQFTVEFSPLMKPQFTEQLT